MRTGNLARQCVHLGLIGLCTIVGGCQPPAFTTDANESVVAEHGLLRLNLKDAPIVVDGHEISQVVVRVETVEIKGPAGWLELPVQAEEYNLLELTEISTVLANEVLPAGKYQQIRLRLSPEGNRIVVDGDTSELTIPSGEQTGIKIIGNFEVENDAVLAILLDFDAQKSVHHSPGEGWMLRPTIKLESVTASTGSFDAAVIDGDAGGQLALADGFSIEFPPGSFAGEQLVWVERFADPAGLITSPSYLVGPSGPLAQPAVLTLPYVAELPEGVEPEDLVARADFAPLDTFEIDAQAQLIYAHLGHFSLLDSTLDNDSLIAITEEELTPAVSKYSSTDDVVPWAVVTVDLSQSQDLAIRGVAAQAASDCDSTFEYLHEFQLKTLPDLLASEGPRSEDLSNPLVAINGTLFKTIESDADKSCFTDMNTDSIGWPIDTTHADGRTIFTDRQPATQYQIRIPSTTAGQTTEVAFERVPAKAPLDYEGPVASSTWQQPKSVDAILSSRHAIIWDGEYVPPIASAAETATYHRPRTAVALLNDGHTLVFVGLGGNAIKDRNGATHANVYNFLRSMFDSKGGVDKAIMFDGGGSTTMLIDGENVPLRSGPGYGDDRLIPNGLAVAPRSGGIHAFARVTTSMPLSCDKNGQNNLRAAWTWLVEPSTAPTLIVRWEKCRDYDNEELEDFPFIEGKVCHVRVGSNLPYDNKRQVASRVDGNEWDWKNGATWFPWYKDETTRTALFSVWPTEQDFLDADCGTEKEFYLTCDSGLQEDAYWHTGVPIVVRKECETD